MSKEKQIEEMADILCEAKEHDCKGGNDCLCVKQSEALYNAGYRKQEWISVDERLPEENVLVVVYMPLQMGFSKFALDRLTSNYHWLSNHREVVTHWMPLPEPPEMKGGAE